MYTTGYYQHNKHNKHPFMHNQTTHPQTNVQCFNFSGLHFYVFSSCFSCCFVLCTNNYAIANHTYIHSTEYTYTNFVMGKDGFLLCGSCGCL